MLSGDDSDFQNLDEVAEGAEEGDSEVSERKSISIEKADRSLSELKRWHDSGRLFLDPEWQRSYVWDSKRASKLIESLLFDIPVPVIYLSKTHGNKYEVIDGVQRLTSVFKYFNNEFSLQSVELLKEVRGKYFKDLDSEMQGKLEDATLRTFELSESTHQDVKFILFERLNTGGVKLTEMEIRNCIFRGSLNSTVKRLADNSDFIICTNQPNMPFRG